MRIFTLIQKNAKPFRSDGENPTLPQSSVLPISGSPGFSRHLRCVRPLEKPAAHDRGPGVEHTLAGREHPRSVDVDVDVDVANPLPTTGTRPLTSQALDS